MQYDIFGQLDKELHNFYRESVVVAGVIPGQHQLKVMGNSRYTFNQFQMLDLIDLYWNSKFESGAKDREGYTKQFLNVVRFSTEVSIKQTDVDVKDYLFVPEDSQSVWSAYFMKKDFKIWAKENEYGELLNDLNRDRNKYGTAVIKIIKGRPERVPMKSLVCPQDAKSLKDAFENGQSVIQVHEMTYDQIMSQKWDKDKLEGIERFEDKVKVYERYGLAKESDVEDGGDPNELITSLTIILEAQKGTQKAQVDGRILFAVPKSDIPFLETHYTKQDNRWLGVGRVETQLEHQKARNTVANLRRRALLWNSKKIFQSTNVNESAKNLIRDVKDGEVLEVGAGGQITQVDQSSRNLADFGSYTQEWQQVSDRDGFDFEVATGESMPSGTPFRLGVVLSNAANTYFKQKQEEFGFFLKKVVRDYLIPEFEKKNEDHKMLISSSDEEAVLIREALVDTQVDQLRVKNLLRGVVIPEEQARAEVERQLLRKKNLFINIRKNVYENANIKFDIVITGESMNRDAKLQTYTELMKVVGVNETLIRKILNLTGDNINELFGQGATLPAQGQAQGAQAPSLNELANQNAPDQSPSAI